MRRLILCILAAWMGIAVRADVNSFLEFSVGGGWSTLTYKLSTPDSRLSANRNGSYNLDFHIGYGLMFNTYVGLGIGADVSRFGAKSEVSGTMQWNDVTDTDGEKYNHLAVINSWADRQELYYVQVPLIIYLNIPTNSIVSLDAEVGVKYAYPFMRNASYQAQVTHSGQYPAWGVTLTDMPNHGFYTADLKGSTHFDALHQVFVFAKIGIAMPIGQRTSFFAHVYADCGTMKAINPNGASEFGLREDTPEAESMHYFMQPATSVMQTDMPSGSFLPVGVGLEAGIRVHFTSHSHKYPCRCLIEDYYFY